MGETGGRESRAVVGADDYGKMDLEEKHAKRSAYMREYYRKNHAYRLAYNREYFRRRRKEISAYERRRRYGLTKESYDALLAKQGGVCGLCKQPLVKAHVDHDHSCCPTKAKCCGRCVRGIICERCNFGLGNFNDNVELLKLAIEYLEKRK